MYLFIQKFHSGWAYLALFVLVIVVLNSFLGWVFKKQFTAKDKKIALFGLITAHIQFVIGLLLYFISPKGLDSLNYMKVPELRLTSLEHPLLNILAIILITIGWVKHKKVAVSDLKFKFISVFYTLGLILILSRIPWKTWFSI